MKKVTIHDKAIIDFTDSETLAQWADLLNFWKWPQELPDKEGHYKPRIIFGVLIGGIKNTRRHQLIKYIEGVLGHRFVLRRGKPWENRSDQQFEDFCTMDHTEYYKKYKDKYP